MHEDGTHPANADPVRAGLTGRCPRCGRGQLFDGFLTTAPNCASCGLDFSFIDAGDGPAVFVMLIVGFVVCGLALWVEVVWSPSLLVHFLIWIPLALLLCLPLLRGLKGLLIALQFKHSAAEGRIDTHDRD